MPTESHVNLKIINLIKPHLTQTDYCYVKCCFVSRTVFKILSVFSQHLTDTQQRIGSIWLRCSASTVSAYIVLYQPRPCSIDPGWGPWLVRTTVNPSGIAWAHACHRDSDARRGDMGGVLSSFTVFV